MRFSVIPAEAGIQYFQFVISSLASGFHRSDDFLRDHQILVVVLFFMAKSGVQLFENTLFT